jgi:predicted RNA methylase
MSLAENIESLRTKLTKTASVPATQFGSAAPIERNDLLDPLLQLATLPELIALRLNKLAAARILLLGDAGQLARWNLSQHTTGKTVDVREWNWSDGLAIASTEVAAGAHVVFCRKPVESSHWELLFRVNVELGADRTSTLGELLAPFLRITTLMTRLDYYVKSGDELMLYYMGKSYFGPLRELNDVFPLQGKRVVEFGCFEGAQTLGLCNLGAAVTCVEARTDNVAKTEAALSAFDFRGDVRIIVDDFHNAHQRRYGTFDLAFAHGVYYHSVSPFVFLENLVSLSQNIFIGGYCATDDLPAEPWETLEHQQRTYRVKKYVEFPGFTAGLNEIAYFFHPADLKRFFEERGYSISVISDETSAVTAGNYSRFIAQR